jgi:hypothetical protein
VHVLTWTAWSSFGWLVAAFLTAAGLGLVEGMLAMEDGLIGNYIMDRIVWLTFFPGVFLGHLALRPFYHRLRGQPDEVTQPLPPLPSTL